MINFIDNQEIVLHNQSFVLAFLNKQLGNPITNNVVDLMKIFNTKFPNESATLDFITTKLNLKIDTGFTSNLNEVFLLHLPNATKQSTSRNYLKNNSRNIS